MSQETNQEVKDEEQLESVDDVEDDDDDLGDPEEVEAELAAASPDDDEQSEDASLEELLAQRAARRTPDEGDNDEDDIMSMSSEAKTPVREPLPSRVIPIRDRQEFVCSSCHLVKAKSQLADPDRLRCRDCI